MLVPLVLQHPAEPCVYWVCGFWSTVEFLGTKMQKLKKLGYKSLGRPVNNGFVLGTNHGITMDSAKSVF